MNRKKKLRLTQFFLMTFALIIIFFTYYNQEENIEKKILSKETQEKVKKQLGVSSEEGDVFYNIEYSGFDLNGNRYILQSEEAINDKIKNEIVKMKYVKAKFYFKDDTVLFVTSDQGVYNNVTLDMTFTKNVKATYNDSKLFAQKAEYSNTKGFLTISDNVKITDDRGKMFADKLLFDIKKQSLNISSMKDRKVNAKVKLK